MRTPILLIDDDEKLAALLVPYLARFDFDLHSETHPDSGVAAVSRIQPHAVLLDLMLPDRDGFQVCREIRKISSVPVLMLTARGETADRVTGLELGADDYIPKPFEPRELVARLQAVLRRAHGATERPEASGEWFGDLRLDRASRRVWLRDQELELTGGEYEMLALLSSEPGKKWDRDEIVNALRGMDSNIYSRSVDILVSRVRAKLGEDSKHPRWIKTVWGSGYVFVATGK